MASTCSSLVLALVLLVSLDSRVHGRPLAGLSTHRKQQRYKLFQVTNQKGEQGKLQQLEVSSSSSSVAPKPAVVVQQRKSSVSTTWRVPKSKRMEKHPGLTLEDYSPPKTHPPSHN